MRRDILPMREALHAMAAALDRCYVLTRYPGEVFPHFFALLRSEAARNPVLRERLELACTARTRPWLRLSGGSSLETALIRVFQGHPQPAESCDMSPDGRYVVSAGPSNQARTLGVLWDAGTGQVLEAFLGIFRPRCRFSPDGKYVAFGEWLWDVEARRMHSALSGHRCCDVAWSPRGGLIASVGDPDGAVVVWRVEVHPEAEAAALGAMKSLAHRPPEYQDEELPLLRKHTIVTTLRLPKPFDAYNSRGARVTFSPEGKFLAAANAESLAVWDTTSFEERLTVRAPESNPSCCFSRDGKRFLWAGQQHIRWWETDGWTELSFPDNDELGSGFDHAFSSDGSGVFAGWIGGPIMYVGLQDAGQTRRRRLHANRLNECRLSPDGRFLLTASDDRTVKLWHADPARILTADQTDDPIRACNFSPDGRIAISASLDGGVRLWDPVTGQETGRLPGHETGVTACGFSPDGRLLVSAEQDLTVRLWDLERRVELTQFPHPGDSAFGGMANCAFSPDGTQILSAGGGTLRVWDVQTLHELRAIRAGTGVFSPDGRLIASGGGDSNETGETITLWNARSGEKAAVLPGHAVPVRACAFSPDGSKLASVSTAGIIKIWQLSEGAELLAFSGHSDWVGGFAFHPRGRLILSAGSDDKLLLWEVDSGTVVAYLYGLSGGWRCCAFSPDGSTIAAGDGFGRLFFFSLASADAVGT